ncbi:hypothetical protein R3P38DRAFT_2775408 [Favolaschia claudopus]|uniref:Uncharacterized protein n=1 Tax=Favolaschia claudopus TaxID=2862362 RepID=A0AAW0BUW4_9AGAR
MVKQTAVCVSDNRDTRYSGQHPVSGSGINSITETSPSFTFQPSKSPPSPVPVVCTSTARRKRYVPSGHFTTEELRAPASRSSFVETVERKRPLSLLRLWHSPAGMSSLRCALSTASTPRLQPCLRPRDMSMQVKVRALGSLTRTCHSYYPKTNRLALETGRGRTALFHILEEFKLRHVGFGSPAPSDIRLHLRASLSGPRLEVDAIGKSSSFRLRGCGLDGIDLR